MLRWFTFASILILFVGRILAADDLPTSDGEESFEIEPPLLIPYDRRQQPLPKDSQPAAAPALDVEKLTRDVERAKRSALNAEHLFRIGVLAKTEAEQRALRVVRLQADLENARLARIKEDVSKAEAASEEKTASPSQTGGNIAKPADSEVAKAIEAAHGAAKRREEAEIAAAETNLARQQKLLSLGSGREAEVAKAARKLEELKAARTN